MTRIHGQDDSIRVLHVDDEPDLAEMAAEFLEREDESFDVETAQDASEGLDRLAGAAFDCVVSDYDMPGRNGIGFLQAVRETHPDLPFILYTGKGSEDVASDAISAGVTDYLQKESGTSQYAVLANRVRNAVEKYRAQTELADREQRLSLFFEQSPLGAIEWNEDFEFVRQNDTAAEILGYSEAELAGESWQRIVPESDRDDVDAVVADLLENAGGHHSVNENVRKDGERIVCEWHNRVVTDDGDVVAVFSKFQDVTEREKRERESERHRHRLEQILKTVPGCVVQVDSSGQFVFANQRAEDVLGLEADEVTDRTYNDPDWDITDLDGEPIPDEELPFRLVMETGEPLYGYRHTIEWGDGTRKVLRVNGAPLFGEDGEIQSTVFALTDVTRSEEREAELRQTTARLEALYEEAPDLINVHDTDGNIVDPNPELCAQTGYDAAELAEMKVWELDTSLEPAEAYEIWEDMETGDRRRVAGTYERRDGSTFPVEVHVRRLRLDGKDRFLANARDVSDRVERTRELERQSERFEYVEDVANIGYWEIDTRSAEPHDVTLSDGVYDILGLSPDEPFDVEAGLEFYHPEDRPTVRQAVRRAITEAEPYEYEARLTTADGRDIWIRSVGQPVERDGSVVAVRGVFQDVTEQKRKERELRRQNERLDEFTSVVSHDLRNPLSVAAGGIELAREECDSDHLADAGNAVDRSLALIDDLLTVAREGGRVDDPEAVDLAAAAEASWRTVETADATLDAGNAGIILADRSRLAQLLENVLRNAVEHGGDGVTVTLGGFDGGFYVADDGPGIPENDRDQVFEAGYSTAREGTGFGLSIVQDVADAHDWEVDVAASDGGGARFEISGVEYDDS